MTRIATFAFDGGYDIKKNLSNMLAGMKEVSSAGAELAIFPEVALQGYPSNVMGHRSMLEAAYDTAERLDGPYVTAITEAAADLSLNVVFGMTERGDRIGELFNAAVLAGPTGLIGVYRKVHLGVSEKVVWSYGRSWPVFPTSVGNIGLLICYDQAFPESCRALTLAGAEILVMPTAWPRAALDGSSQDGLAEEHYLLYGRARAVDNFRWFVSSNYSGELGGRKFFGHSQVIDPTGRIVAEVGSDEKSGWDIVDIDVRGGIECAYAKTVSPGERIWRDRRPDSYSIISDSVESERATAALKEDK